LVLFIFLAGMGVGLVGGVPVPLSKRKEDDPLFKIELVEKKNDADEQIPVSFRIVRFRFVILLYHLY